MFALFAGVQLVTNCPRCQARWRLKVAVAVLYALCFILLFSLVVLGCVGTNHLVLLSLVGLREAKCRVTQHVHFHLSVHPSVVYKRQFMNEEQVI